MHEINLCFSLIRELDKKEELDDTCHYRGIISATNEEEKKATVFLIDYAKSLVRIRIS